MARILRKGTKDRTSATRIARVSLQVEALRLRRDGHNLDEIARILSPQGTMNEGQVQYLIQTALKTKLDEPAEDVRRAELDRLDRVDNYAWRMAQKGGPGTAALLNTCLNAQKRRAELLGLDAPKKVDLSDNRNHDIPTTAIQDLVARLAAEAERDGSDGGSQVAEGNTG